MSSFIKLIINCLLLLAIAIGLGFFYFTYKAITLEPPAKLTKADAIIILTGAEHRIEAGLRLLQANHSPNLLISGVNEHTGRRLLKQNFRSYATLFDCCIDLDNKARNTEGNAREGVTWLEKHNYRRAYLVTHDYHMARALYEFHLLDPKIEYIPYPIHESKVWGLPRSWSQWRLFFLEYIKLLGRRLFLKVV